MTHHPKRLTALTVMYPSGPQNELTHIVGLVSQGRIKVNDLWIEYITPSLQPQPSASQIIFQTSPGMVQIGGVLF